MTPHASMLSHAAPGRGRTLTIGLVNNMPGAVLKQTETQFRDLITAAAPNSDVRLELFCLPGRVHEGLVQQRVATCYRSFDAVFDMPLDGLIVTGLEPRAASLRDEPYWPSFARLVDDASDRALPTVWSCLAAHAAVLHLSDVERRRRPAKLSGLFQTLPAPTDHAYAAGLPRQWLTPHSRQYDVAEADLAAAGYQVLTRARLGQPDGASVVDAFALTELPFLFLQGHPEYDRRALLREYVRDVRRALDGEVRRVLDGRPAQYPQPPTGYFGAETVKSLTEIGQDADHADSVSLTRKLNEAVLNARLRPVRTPARSVFANWVAMLAAPALIRPIEAGTEAFVS